MAEGNVPVGKSASFFSLNAEYLVAPESTPGQLMNDVGCLLGSAESILAERAESIGADGWAALYLLRQALGSHRAAHDMLFAAGGIED
jgi:hypothetical protein